MDERIETIKKHFDLVIEHSGKGEVSVFFANFSFGIQKDFGVQNRSATRPFVPIEKFTSLKSLRNFACTTIFISCPPMQILNFTGNIASSDLAPRSLINFSLAKSVWN